VGEAASAPRARTPLRRLDADLRRDALQTLTELKRTQGDLAHARLGSDDFVLVSALDDVERVLVTDAADYVRQSVTSVSRLRKAPLPDLEGFLGRSDHAGHQAARRRLQPVFARGRIDAEWPRLAATAAAAVDDWPVEGTVDLLNELRRIAIPMSAEATLGERFAAPVDELMPLLEAVYRLSVGVTSPARDIGRSLRLRRVAAAAAAFDELLGVLERQLRGRREAGADGNDLLSVLVRIGADEELPDRLLAREAFGALFIAADGTVGAGAWVLHQLARHPQLAEQVRTECARLEPAASEPPARSDVPVTSAFVTETFRLYPVAWMLNRRARVDAELGGVRIPAGSFVWISPYLVHRDPRWYEEPERFDVGRWLGSAAEAHPKLAYLGFGVGAHRCMGETLALRELTAIVAAVLARYDLGGAEDVALTAPVDGQLLPAGRKLYATVARR
jgi:cytochrome P450